MARSYRSFAVRLLVVAVGCAALTVQLADAISMSKVELAVAEEKAAIAKVEIAIAEEKAAAADADSVMPDAQVAIGAEAEEGAAVADAPVAAAKETDAPVAVPAAEEKKDVVVPAAEEPVAAAAAAAKEVPAAVAAEKVAEPVPVEKDDAAAPPAANEEGKVVASNFLKEKAKVFDAENDDAPDEDEDDDDDDEGDQDRLYADQEEDFEDEYDQDEANLKAKGKDAAKEYKRYLDEKAAELEADPEMRANLIIELEEMREKGDGIPDKEDDLLELARSIQDKEDGRTRLEEQERELVDQQRRAAVREMRENNGVESRAGEFDFKDKDRQVWMNEDGVDHKALVQIAKRRAATMGHLDRNRRVAFMQHEMKRLLNFKKTLADVTDKAEKERLLEEHEKENDELAKRRGNAPMHKAQLEDVWEEEDGLDKESFDPKTFFRLHDITGDGVLDAKELEAMFFREASKLHSIRTKKADKDPKQRTGKEREMDKFIVREEMSRMREHVMKTADQDGDGTVSYKEWQEMTARKDFDENKEWKPVNPEQEMTDKQLANFKKLQAKLQASKHKEMDPKMLNAAKRMRKALTPKQKDALQKLQKQRGVKKAAQRERLQKLAFDAKKKKDERKEGWK